MGLNRRTFFRQALGSFLFLGGWRSHGTGASLPAYSAQTSRQDARFWSMVRKLFPLSEDRIYFNAGGLGPTPYPVLEAMDALRQKLEAIGETGHHYHEPVRRKVAHFLGADPEEIAFTRNATEGMNFIARGIPLQRGDEIVTTTHEHPGGAMPWLALAREKDLQIRLFEPDNDPEIFMANLKRAVTPKTRVLMFSHVTCTLGTVFKAREICAWAKARRMISVIDGAQAIGQIPVQLTDIGCDFYTASGHKWLLGPKETGIVYISKSARPDFQPSFVGAYSDQRYSLDDLALEFRRDAIVNEYGTRDAAKVWGLGAAIDFIQSLGQRTYFRRIQHLSGVLKSSLQSLHGVELLTPLTKEQSAGIVTFRLIGRDYRDVSRQLMQQYRIRVRNVSEHQINAIRVSLHIYNSEKEINRLINALETMLKG